MEKHGVGYWLIHLLVAMLATILYEFLSWLAKLYS